MRCVLRVCWALLAVLLCALSASGAPGGGGGGGDTGVWILPNSRPMLAMPVGNPFPTTPRAVLDVPNPTAGVFLQMPNDMGAVISRVYLRSSGALVPTVDTGRVVEVPSTVLRAVQAGQGEVEGYLLDINGNGFLLRIVRIAGGVQLQVF